MNKFYNKVKKHWKKITLGFITFLGFLGTFCAFLGNDKENFIDIIQSEFLKEMVNIIMQYDGEMR